MLRLREVSIADPFEGSANQNPRFPPVVACLMAESPVNVTQLLLQLSEGREAALDELISKVYSELRRIAHRHLNRERSDHTLRTTELVHEAYARLVDHHQVEWEDKNHFFAVAARAMRQLLVEHARRKNAEKRGGDASTMPLDEVQLSAGMESPVTTLALDEALRRLEALDARQARVVQCRVFAGLTVEETADALDISPSTVKRDWRTARAWLARELRSDRSES